MPACAGDRPERARVPLSRGGLVALACAHCDQRGLAYAPFQAAARTLIAQRGKPGRDAKIQILFIRLESAGPGYRFIVQRIGAAETKAALAVELADPLQRVLGETKLKLGDELAWYLEQYLDYRHCHVNLETEQLPGA